MFNLEQFINEHVISRTQSMFLTDINNNKDKLIEKINSKSILVIGGAGTIGSSFIKTILPFKPSKLIVVDINENALAELTRDLRSTKELYMPKEYITYPMNFISPVFEKLFYYHKGFDIVANFSAHKHVRSEKDIYSVEALIQNNILHSTILLELMKEFPPEEYFCVSTDKATNPVNIMGASKRIMEDVAFSYSDIFPVKTARFANVAFSNGSLPAGFLTRISKLQAISAPFDVKRYFVSPEESGQICMLACMLGENREIFFPKLFYEQMITFDKIATELLHAHGFEVLECNSDIEAIEKAKALINGSNLYPVHYSNSDTSGEKAFEEFYTHKEIIDMNKYSALGIITNKKIPDKAKINKLFCKLTNEFNNSITTKEQIVQILKEYLPDFNHIETGKSLDSKM